jgi:GLPGLI family protein
VEYQVTYPDIDSENNMMAAGLPDKAVFKFKDEKSMTHLSAMMGLVTIDYIADRKENSAKQSLVLFNNKYVANLNEAAVNKLNAGFLKELKLVPGETKMIAGYKCEKAKAILENGKEVDVYYTRDLGGDEINFGNPYHEIKGVLMEFEIERYGISMKLQATKVAKEGVEEKDFTVPQDFKKMPIEELENILKTLNPIK